MEFLNKYKKLIFKVLISVVLITIIVSKIDKDQFFQNIRLADPKYFILIFCLIVTHYFIGAFRWKRFLIHDNTQHITVGYLASLYFIGSFFNNFMPTSVGGDVYKVYKLSKKINNLENAFASTFMERFTGIMVLSVIAILSSFNFLKYWSLLIILGFVIATVVGLKVAEYLSKKFKFITKFYSAFLLYRNSKGILMYAIFTSFLIQLLAIFTQYFVFVSLGIWLPIFYSLLVFPLITLAGFFIPSLNGVGVQDATYMYFFSLIGVPVEISLSASILYHLSRLFVSLIGGVLYALNKDD